MFCCWKYRLHHFWKFFDNLIPVAGGKMTNFKKFTKLLETNWTYVYILNIMIIGRYISLVTWQMSFRTICRPCCAQIGWQKNKKNPSRHPETAFAYQISRLLAVSLIIYHWKLYVTLGYFSDPLTPIRGGEIKNFQKFQKHLYESWIYTCALNIMITGCFVGKKSLVKQILYICGHFVPFFDLFILTACGKIKNFKKQKYLSSRAS